MATTVSSGLRDKAADLPDRPGCYLFRSATGRLLYVGKAKSLRRRVLSYFQAPDAHSPKTLAMLKEVSGLEVIVCATEVDALILENNLVKKHRPRFNVLLRDDKNFPYLKLTLGDEFPRVVLVRRPKLDGSLYFGPYTPASIARRSLKMVARFFQVATCYERFDGSRKRPCILYQMHQCLAPCVRYVDPDPYWRAVEDVRLFLEGKDAALARSLSVRMRQASEQMEYERAAQYRDLLAAVKALRRQPTVASVGLEDQDYFGLHSDGGRSVLEVFEMRAGLVQSRREFFLEDADPNDGRFLAEALVRYYAAAPTLPSRVFVTVDPEGAVVIADWLGERRGRRTRIDVPRRGVHRRFLDTVEENARLAWSARFGADHSLGVAVHERLRDLAGLTETPSRIEAFDVSHVQGTDTVAAVVVWEGGRPRRSAYRRMRIRAPVAGDDYAAMGEAVRRRYARLTHEGEPLPDLVLVDGGKGQLSAACAALASLGIGTVPVVALAKREETLYLPGREEGIPLAADSPIRHLATRIRDEAHRFAVTYHRRRRRARTLHTALTEVSGIGRKRAGRLLRAFGSVAGVRRAAQEELERAVGRRAALAVRARLGTDGRGGRG